MKIIKINSNDPDPEKIRVVKDLLKRGKIVVYPTDTVYGIAANIFDENAILKVFSGQETF